MQPFGETYLRMQLDFRWERAQLLNFRKDQILLVNIQTHLPPNNVNHFLLRDRTKNLTIRANLKSAQNRVLWDCLQTLLFKQSFNRHAHTIPWMPTCADLFVFAGLIAELLENVSAY